MIALFGREIYGGRPFQKQKQAVKSMQGAPSWGGANGGSQWDLMIADLPQVMIHMKKGKKRKGAACLQLSIPLSQFITHKTAQMCNHMLA